MTASTASRDSSNADREYSLHSMSRGDFGSHTYGSTARMGSPQRDRVDLGFSSSEGEGYQSFDSFRDFEGQSRELSNTVQSIATNTSHMEKLVKQIGTPSDAPGLRRRLTDLRSSVKDQVANTGHALKRMEESTRGPGHRTERLRLERLKSEYSDVAKRYRNVLRSVMEAERSPAGSLSHYVRPPGMSSLHDPSEDDSQGLMEAHRQREAALEQLQRQEDDIEFNQAVIEEREDNIRAIETEILEINEMFRDLGTLVHEQGEQVDLIEANITKTKTTVEEGKEQLQSASKYQKKARTKMCILLIILLVIAAVVAIIIAVEVK